MILIAGLPEEGPIARVLDAFDASGIPCVMLDQRTYEDISITISIDAQTALPVGTITLPGGSEVDIAKLSAIYARLHGPECIRDLAALPATAPPRMRFDRLTALLTQLCDLAPARVVNRSAGMITNASKPLQAQIILQAGFAIPKTLVTKSPAQAKTFLAAAPDGVIFKSASSVRSIVRELQTEDLNRLDALRLCPVQFQHRVAGTDIRVHVIGQQVFATRIETTGSDYRYARQEDGGETRLYATELPTSIAARCINLAQQLDLAFAGIDLRITPEGDWVCFEVNPSPGYSYYEGETGQPIAAGLVEYLAGETD